MLDAFIYLAENLIFNQMIQRISSFTNVNIHSSYEIIVAYFAIGSHCEKSHQIMDFVIFNADFQRCESLSEFLFCDNAVTIDIKQLEGLFQIELLNVKCGSNSIQSLIQSQVTQISCFEPTAEQSQLNSADTRWIGNSSKDSLILHC